MFAKSKAMLWNAKMRFGKTLSALQFIKEMGYARTIIVTHRPVVNEGWFEDFGKIFNDTSRYQYGSKIGKGEENINTLETRAKEGKGKYIWFASLQDARGSAAAGGKFDKNDELFAIEWDLLIIDEAHEGTLTEKGKKTLNGLQKHSKTKVLNLTGTAFNLVEDFDEKNTYTWDYIMEQEAKREWDKTHQGDPNPYACLPQMNIWTYNLGTLLLNFGEEDEVAFNFREFLRTSTGTDGREHFVHEKDVVSFLNLMSHTSDFSLYPFSTQAYRDIFNHTLWMVPGVKAAAAMADLLRRHDVFSYFNIVNVAGDGDEEVDSHTALTLVQNAIANNKYTITLSCGRLTTGVSVPQWTAVMLLAGSASTAASSYMQTIFRVQTPATIEGRMKTDCYVFDFAPDRTLRIITETMRASAKPGETSEQDRKRMGAFLNFCPVIGIEGSSMTTYSTEKLLQQLKRVYVDRVVRSGFEDMKLYNDELLKLDEVQLKDFDGLKKIIGTTPAMARMKDIDINRQGLTNEQYDEQKTLEKKPKRKRTPEEQARLDELKAKRSQRDNAVSILRGISIRMPLIIYGADIRDEDKELTIDNFTSLVDSASWQEFMPKGVTKAEFNKFKRYYDPDIFNAAGKRIRALARAADKLSVEERIERITDLFANFRNPDKETVLTPWRVVNMHLTDTLGGWCFYNEDYTQTLAEPRHVAHDNVTDNVFHPYTHILEINSKTGLYPLYAAYSVYRARLAEKFLPVDSVEDQQRLWDLVCKENIFVVCMTPMAQAITRRTLTGFRKAEVNAQHFPNLINTIKTKPDNFIAKVKQGKDFWQRNENNNMKFNAVIGNPPYQVTTAKKETANGQKRSQSIFHYFQMVSDRLGNYTSLIYPGKRWIHRSGKGMEEFGLKQINDPHLCLLKFYPQCEDIFKDVGIADGISIVLKHARKTTPGFTYVYCLHGNETTLQADNPGEKLFAINPLDVAIAARLEVAVDKYSCLHDAILPQKLFGIESDFVEKNPALVRPYNEGDSYDKQTEIKLFTTDKAGKSGRSRWYTAKRAVIASGCEYLDKWKVVVSSANAGGQKRSNQLAVLDDHSAFGRSRVALKTFDTEQEARNFFRYASTDIIRFALLLTDENLTSLAKKVPDLPSYADDNGLVDFSKDLNAQLCQLFGIDEPSQAYIRKVIADKDGR